MSVTTLPSYSNMIIEDKKVNKLVEFWNQIESIISNVTLEIKTESIEEMTRNKNQFKFQSKR